MMKVKKILNTSFDDHGLDVENIKKSLIEENNFLLKLVDMIPAKMYFEQEIKEKIMAEKHSTMDKAAEELKRKSFSQISLSAKSKHKRARLDPDSQKSVSQIHNELSSKKKRKKKKKGMMLLTSESLARAANIGELQRRLQDRINILHAKRNALGQNPEAKKTLKLKVKKLKLKHKKQISMKFKELNTTENHLEKKISDKPAEKPVFNKDAGLIYSKFDFNDEDMLEDSKKKKPSGKNTKDLLVKAEKMKEKLDHLKSTDPKKAKLVEEKEKWKKAIQKVEGIKVKDDPKLLKRTLRKEQQRKKKSAKEWKQREEDTEKRMQARQEKRNRNIKQKKQEKLDRKIKLAKKKGRVIPGF